MKWFIFLFAILILVVACRQSYQLCPDGVTQVTDVTLCPEIGPSCPESCDDANTCTQDVCSSATNFQCEHRDVAPCSPNGKCETGEYPWSPDCPSECGDANACTNDFYSYESGRCVHDPIVPCCGNNQCDSGETYVSCGTDCQQQVDIEVTKYERRQTLEGAQNDLRNTEYTFTIVVFKIHNILLDSPETLNFRTENGYYYDPYKLRVEDDKGTLYAPEYDSDLLPGYLDYMIISKGQTIGASLLFVVPLKTEHLRLVAYDKFGSRLDVSDVY